MSKPTLPRGQEGQGGESAPSLLDRLSRFEGPRQEFLALLLETQCRTGPAESGALLCAGGEHGMALLALWPPPEGGAQPAWLSRAAAAMPDGASARNPDYKAPGRGDRNSTANPRGGT